MKKVEVIKEKGKPDRKKVSTVNTKPSMTDQSYKDSTDAKLIVKQFIKTGVINHLAKVEGQYQDVSEVNSLYESMSKVKEVESYFMDLPAEIRKKFDNDPQKMLHLIVDDEREQEQIDLGLKKPETTEETTDVKNTGADQATT